MSEAPSFTYEIDVSRLDGQDLPEGDKILVQHVGPSSNPNNVEFELKLKQDMWWKGLVLFTKDKSNEWQEVVAGDYNDMKNPDYKLKDVAISFSLLQNKFACLSKAKGAGVHYNVYHLPDADTSFKQGEKYSISWLKD